MEPDQAEQVVAGALQRLLRHVGHGVVLGVVDVAVADVRQIQSYFPTKKTNCATKIHLEQRAISLDITASFLVLVEKNWVICGFFSFDTEALEKGVPKFGPALQLLEMSGR